MTIKEIEYILATAESASISEAAKKLFVSQPGITHAIQCVETEIGFKIFVRGRLGVEITPEGHEFLNDIRLVYEQMIAMERKYINKVSDKKMFSVSLQHFQFGLKTFTELIKNFDDENYTVKIIEDDLNNVITNVSESVSGLGVIIFSERYKNVIMKETKDIGLEFYEILQFKPYVYINKNHYLSTYDEVSFKELSDYPSVMFDKNRTGGLAFEDNSNYVKFDKKIIVNDSLDLISILSETNAYCVGGYFSNEFLEQNGFIKMNLVDAEKAVLGWIKKKDAILNKIEMEYLKLLNIVIERYS